MRVITGTARGTKLTPPEGLQTRPTADRIKEALFNIIQFDIEGRRVLDLFGGTAQLGIEALSRGADHAVFVDKDRTAVLLMKDNLTKTKMQSNSEVVQADYMQYLNSCRQKFDLIFMDPPYGETLLENALQKISEIDILTEGGIIICERLITKEDLGSFNGLKFDKDYKYGKTCLSVYRKVNSEESA